MVLSWLFFGTLPSCWASWAPDLAQALFPSPSGSDVSEALLHTGSRTAVLAADLGASEIESINFNEDNNIRKTKWIASD